jgi:hypothetical protein
LLPKYGNKSPINPKERLESNEEMPRTRVQKWEKKTLIRTVSDSLQSKHSGATFELGSSLRNLAAVGKRHETQTT